MEQPFKCNKTFKWKIGLTTHSKIHQAPQLTSQKWGELDCHLNDLIGPLHHRLSCREPPSNVAADELAGIISFFLESVPEFQEVEKQFFERKESTSLE